METCPECGGSGEVHSHNPICFTCNGKGLISSEKAEAERQYQKRLNDARKLLRNYIETQ